VKVLLEVEAGRGHWVVAKDVGSTSPQFITIWALVGLDLRNSIGNQSGDQAQSQLDRFIDQLRTDPNIAAQLTQEQTPYFEGSIEYLTNLRDICETNDLSIVRIYP
jgi:hypothetical protein